MLAGLCAIAALATAASAAPVPAAPAAMSIPLGTFTLTALRDAENIVPNDGSVFGTNSKPAAVSRVLAAAGARPDHVALGVDALLVRMPGHVVLIDSGLGAGAHGALMDSLKQADVKPAMVTDVLLTHSHPDHAGGLVTATGAPAFPRAAIRMSTAEWAWMRSRPDSATLVRAIGEQVRAFVPGKPLLPGIMPIAIAGHTPGHVGYEISSNGRHLLDIGDTAHSSIVSLADPDWTISYDGDQAVGARSRRAVLGRLATSRELVFAPHFPFPGFGRIVSRGNGFAWVPLH